MKPHGPVCDQAAGGSATKHGGNVSLELNVRVVVGHCIIASLCLPLSCVPTANIAPQIRVKGHFLILL